jgi:glutamyl/glutaminyl-tRNA synthetase
MLTRLAPTPSGYIHIGNIFNFLLNWLWAKSNGGKVLLRIDDADAERKRKEYVEDIFRVLDWLQLDWDIGPAGPDDFEKNWSQTRRTDLYNETLNELLKKEMLFACTCSRKQICNCENKHIPLTQANAAWKIKILNGSAVSFNDNILGTIKITLQPFVVKRKNGLAAYQLCSLVDDKHFQVTHIGRGEDLKEPTAMQIYIDSVLKESYLKNCIFWHHSLVNNNDGIKLSKSAGAHSQSISTTTTKEKIFSAFTQWMGWKDFDGSNLQDMKTMPVFKNIF